MNNNSKKYLELPKKAKPFVDSLRELWKFAEKEMRGKTFQTKNDLRLIILLQITAAGNRLIHSVLAQIDSGSFYGLDFLLRPLIEAMINYKYIKEDITQMRARAFISDDINIRLKEIRKLIPLLEQNSLPAMKNLKNAEQYKKLEKDLLQEKNEIEGKYGKDNLNFLNIAERATKSETSGIYVTAYWLLCQDTHLTSRGLDRYMAIKNGQLSITYDIELNRFIMTLKTFYITFMALLSECNEQFATPNKIELDILNQNFGKL